MAAVNTPCTVLAQQVCAHLWLGFNNGVSTDHFNRLVAQHVLQVIQQLLGLEEEEGGGGWW